MALELRRKALDCLLAAHARPDRERALLVSMANTWLMIAQNEENHAAVFLDSTLVASSWSSRNPNS
jgi:hypothetical protein